MTVLQEELTIRTRGRATHDLGADLARIVTASGVRRGLCNVFALHTSASLVICENADPQVHRDLEAFMAHLVPDGDPLFRHVSEGIDDMPAHVRSVLTQHELTLPVREGACVLGTWQGVYLWEHRARPQVRRVLITVWGE